MASLYIRPGMARPSALDPAVLHTPLGSLRLRGTFPPARERWIIAPSLVALRKRLIGVPSINLRVSWETLVDRDGPFVARRGAMLSLDLCDSRALAAHVIVSLAAAQARGRAVSLDEL